MTPAPWRRRGRWSSESVSFSLLSVTLFLLFLLLNVSPESRVPLPHAAEVSQESRVPLPHAAEVSQESRVPLSHAAEVSPESRVPLSHAAEVPTTGRNGPRTLRKCHRSLGTRFRTLRKYHRSLGTRFRTVRHRVWCRRRECLRTFRTSWTVLLVLGVRRQHIKSYSSQSSSQPPKPRAWAGPEPPPP